MGTKPYTVEIFGIPHTVLLSDEEAEKRGLTAPPDVKPVRKGRVPENKAATPNAKADDGEP